MFEQFRLSVSRVNGRERLGDVDPLPQDVTSNLGVSFGREIFSEFIEFCDECCLRWVSKQISHAPTPP
jgi:hypothetical protein